MESHQAQSFEASLCLAVLDGIMMSLLSALKKSLSLRAVEIALAGASQRRSWSEAGGPAAQGGGRGIYADHTTETRSRSNREADGGYPSAHGHGGNRASLAGCGGVGPQKRMQQRVAEHAPVPQPFPEETVGGDVGLEGMRPTANRRACTSGRDCPGGEVATP